MALYSHDKRLTSEVSLLYFMVYGSSDMHHSLGVFLFRTEARFHE